MITRVAVWMRLSDLPFGYWDRESNLEFGSMAGRPVSVDACTEALLKGAFARVYVEIDVTKPLMLGVSWNAGGS